MTMPTDTYAMLTDALLQRAVETNTEITLVLNCLLRQTPDRIPDPTLQHIAAALLSLLGDPADSFTDQLVEDIEFRMDTAD
jgi:hypothetical protein